MADKPNLTPDEWRQLLSYDPKTGLLRWKPRQVASFASEHASKIWHTRFSGQVAGTTCDEGYVRIYYKGTRKAHRVIWAIHYGEDPVVAIDHIDGDRSNNRITNLRLAPGNVNSKNQSVTSRKKCGRIGVRLDPRYSTWSAQVVSEGRKFHLGSFQTFEEAVAARIAAEKILGFHANHGRSR